MLMVMDMSTGKPVEDEFGAVTNIGAIGVPWLTRNGDIEDYLLSPGQSFAVRRGDRAVVQALQPSRMRLVV